MNMSSIGLTSPDKTYTLDQFINAQGSDDITYYNFSILEKFGGVEHLDRNIVEDYLPELTKISEIITLSDEEYRKFKRKPDLLAYYAYGSIQFEPFILMLNDMIDPKDFINRKVRLVIRSDLINFFSRLYGAESGYIDYNREQVWKS